MKLRIIILYISLVFVFLFGVTQNLYAQNDTRSQTVGLYNNAQELAGNSQFQDAIDVYRQALDLAQENQFNDITELIEERLPRVYASRAANAFREYQSQRTISSVNSAIEYFKLTKETANEFNNTQIVQQATAAIPQLYFTRSILHFQEGNPTDAMSDLDSAIEAYPNYAAAYLKKGEFYNELYPDNHEEVLNYFNLALEKAITIGDNRTRNQAQFAIEKINTDLQFDNEGWEIVANFTGSGAENTAPFNITSDEWKIQYRSFQVGDGGHSFILHLKEPGDRIGRIVVNEVNQRIISGETYFYDAGRFYIDSSSTSGDWQAIILIPKTE